MLTFETRTFRVSELGPESSVPDLVGASNIQNKTRFFLEETDEIYEGYGKKETSYPYRQYCCYSRDLEEKELETAVLENDNLRAVFLPSLGGRLWELWDKKTGQNLLYTNDVIRPSNLAIRNAWFSGGVEWNISMIGHTPFTTEPLFTAVAALDDGTPVLRMYEYERLRRVTYQMDFWLGEQDTALNCRFRIWNQTEDVVPMYWWSNMAVPEHRGGRIVVPAEEAFTNRADGVHKTAIPLVNGIDITRYDQIPDQVDYFFHIPEASPKYIAHLDKNGYGLFHLSTSRLKSRKLFSWGCNTGSDHWQAFLTNQAGRYVEIQAGLAKTQYGCLPMAPHTVWEWMEQYGPIQVDAHLSSAPYAQVRTAFDQLAKEQLNEHALENLLLTTKAMALRPASLHTAGSGFGALEQHLRAQTREGALAPHLDFGEIPPSLAEWKQLVDTGSLPKPDPKKQPSAYPWGTALHQLLCSCTAASGRENWYAHYMTALSYLKQREGTFSDSYGTQKALEHLQLSLQLEPTPWAWHALAVIAYKTGHRPLAVSHIRKGLELRRDDLSYVKEGFRLLLLCEAYEDLLEEYEKLPEAFARESRLFFDWLTARARTGHAREVFDLLQAEPLVLTDLRECEESLGSLWEEVHQALFGNKGEVPYAYQFSSLAKE